jgi:hypothetical protein
MSIFLRIFVFMLAFTLGACDDGHLRGSVKKSDDGKTYLLVAEGNNCNQIKVDGKLWNHAIGEAGEISPGEHVIDCNGEIGFFIPAGVVFSFDYWGP